MSRSNLTDALFGYTFVRRIEFVIEPSDGVCILSLDLSRTSEYGTDIIRAKFVGVVELSIRNTGNGIMQFSLLTVEDISKNGMEHMNYQVREAEDDSISFVCRSINVESIGNQV